MLSFKSHYHYQSHKKNLKKSLLPPRAKKYFFQHRKKPAKALSFATRFDLHKNPTPSSLFAPPLKSASFLTLFKKNNKAVSLRAKPTLIPLSAIRALRAPRAFTATGSFKNNLKKTLKRVLSQKTLLAPFSAVSSTSFLSLLYLAIFFLIFLLLFLVTGLGAPLASSTEPAPLKIELLAPPAASNQTLTTIENSEFSNVYIPLSQIGDFHEEQLKPGKSFTPAVLPLSPKEQAWRFKRHVVQRGDSLFGLANKYRVSIDALISLNQLKEVHKLKINSLLKLPALPGVYYSVRKGDSLSALSRRYGVSLKEVEKYNEVRSFLAVGARLFFPNAKLPTEEKQLLFGDFFILPLRQPRLTSTYGMRHHPIKKKLLFHTGVDLVSPISSAVLAAASGTVKKVLYDADGYGNYVVLRHRRGYTTRYAHLSQSKVRVGQTVKQGQKLGTVGSTGLSTGPHLHFEVLHEGKFLNPLRFLKLGSKINGKYSAYR